MSQYVAEKSASAEIERREQLIEFFTAGAKPRDRWRVGTEYEKIAVRAADGHAAPFSGHNGIEALLGRLADRYGWEPLLEDGRTVALKGRRAWVTLEPGGQVELSGEQCDSVHCAEAEFSSHVREIVTVGHELGLAFLGLGMQPVSRPDQIEWVPKQRYRIMAPHMQRVGPLGHRMMKQTAGVQVNLDYGSEADAMRKLRVGMGLVPILSAMFANSPLKDGSLSDHLSFRGHIWTGTDAARCGLLPLAFRDGAGFEDYADAALDVPMYFIVRNGRWFDMTSVTFRQFLRDGHAGHRATLADWSAHLTTLFWEVRLKAYLEIRCFDSQTPDLVLSIPALVKGIFYESDCLDGAWDLVKRWTAEERAAAYDAAHREALRARAHGHRLADLANELVAIARSGLRRQRAVNLRGEDETIFLDRLAEMTGRGACPADRTVEKWKGEWNYDAARLVQGTAYRLSD